MKSILLAGGAITPNDPLFDYRQYGTKGLIPINGKPMVQWVLDALCQSRAVDEIFIMGLDQSAGLVSSRPLVFLPGQESLFENIRYGTAAVHQASGKDETIILASGDIPSLTPVMVDWLVGQGLHMDYDLVYSVVPRSVMEGTFPGSNRSYIKFKDIDICGGDINLISTRLMQQATGLWEQLAESRKSAMKQLSMVGFDTLLLMLFKVITLDQAAERICRKLKIRGKALPVPYAEMGMDVDKPHQLELITQFMAGRAG